MRHAHNHSVIYRYCNSDHIQLAYACFNNDQLASRFEPARYGHEEYSHSYGRLWDEAGGICCRSSVAQSGLSRKLNRRTDWTMSDIANAACFFNISVADLVLPITFSTGLRPDYQLRTQYAADNAIPSQELAGAAGPRYIVRPDDARTRKSAERTIRPAPS